MLIYWRVIKMVMGRGEKLNDGKPSFEENSCKTVQNRDVMEI